jgi:hypothetical protein
MRIVARSRHAAATMMIATTPAVTWRTTRPWFGLNSPGTRKFPQNDASVFAFAILGISLTKFAFTGR